MQDRQNLRPWLPRPFSVAVLDSDAYLGDTLGALLRERGFAPAVYYDASAFLDACREEAFDAYVLDAIADWPRRDDLREVVASVSARAGATAPVFILGNHASPERDEVLAEVLMRHKVRYVLRPVRATYLAAQIGEELARRAGL